MKDSKLIIVTGMSGAGKSTTSQQLAKQYEQNNIPCLWVHEEIAGHPIREGEFEVSDLHTAEGMEKNIRDMYERWTRLADEIEQSGLVYVMEGCLYQNIVRYFFDANYPLELITEYYDCVMQIIDRLNPTIIFVYRSDVKASFEEAFKVRGERWQRLIMDPNDPYFRTHEYTGEESTFAMYEEQQRIANMMFERYQGNKIKLCTSDGQLNKNIQALTEFMGLGYFPPKTPPPLVNPAQYCGRFVLDIDGRENGVTFKAVDGNLYCQLSWWSNMTMIPLGNDEFEAMSFPIKFVFHLDGEKRSVDVKGVYGWGITGKTLWEK